VINQSFFKTNYISFIIATKTVSLSNIAAIGLRIDLPLGRKITKCNALRIPNDRFNNELRLQVIYSKCVNQAHKDTDAHDNQGFLSLLLQIFICVLADSLSIHDDCVTLIIEASSWLTNVIVLRS